MPSPLLVERDPGRRARPGGELGIECLELPIEPAMRAYEAILGGVFAGRPADLTEENLQARIRGNLLMALSNKFGWLVLTTGNKSEMSVGYSTLYGDSAGGFAVIKDCEKTLVFRLARHRGGIPAAILERPPSAELRPDQRDDDSLPPYELLDTDPPGLRRGGPRPGRARRRRPAGRGGRPGDPPRRPRRVQAPPGPARLKITERAFGRDRRMPITNRYRG